jgi:hypothetical protein
LERQHDILQKLNWSRDARWNQIGKSSSELKH